MLARRRALLRLVTNMLLCGVAVVVLMGALFSFYLARVISGDAFDASVEILSQTRTTVEFLLREVEKTAYALCMNEEVERTLWAPWTATGDLDTLRKIGALFANRVASSDYILSIALYVEKAGRVVTSAGVVDLAAYAGRPVLDDFLAGGGRQAWIQSRSVDEERGAPATTRVVTFALAVPVRGTGRDGVLFVNLKEDWFYSFVVSVNNSQLGSVAILNSSGSVVSGRDPDAFASSFGPVFATDPALRGERAFVVRPVDGQRMFLASITSQLNGWRYVAVLPAARLYARLRLVLWVTLGIAGAGLLIAALLSIVVSVRYYRPVDRLVQVVSRGGVAEDGNGKGRDEFHVIRQSLTRLLEENDEFRRDFARNEIALKEHFLLDLLLGRIDDPAEVSRLAGYFAIDLPSGPVLAMAARLYWPASGAASTEHERNLVRYRAQLIVQQTIGEAARCVVVSQDAEHLVAAVGASLDGEPGGDWVKKVALSAGGALRGELGVNTSWGIGRRYPRLQDVHVSYLEAFEALAYERISGPGTIIAVDDVELGNGSRADRVLNQKRVAELASEAKGGNGEKAATMARSLVEDLNANRNLGYHQKSIMLMQLVDALVTSALDVGLDLDRLFCGHGNPYRDFARLESMEEIKAWLGTAFQQMGRLVSEHRGGRNRALIERVTAYLRDHYREPVSIKQMADVVYLNPSYFSKLFRELTGTTFLEHVVAIRLEKARALLRESRLPLATVAKRSGFGTKLNLIRAFRRQLGMTPTEYRRRDALERLSAEVARAGR